MFDIFLTFPPSKPRKEITLPPLFFTYFIQLIKFFEFPDADISNK